MYFSTGAQLSAALLALPNANPDGTVGQYLAFDGLYYSNEYMLNGNTNSLTALDHFVQLGAAAMASPNSTFDPVFYKQQYADLRETNFNAADLIYHFMAFGLDEGRAPNAELAGFDGNAYLAAYPSVAEYVQANLDDFGGSETNGAIAHYVKFGIAQGFEPFFLPDGSEPQFTLTPETVAGADSMHLTGDMAIRIDFTNPANQITGQDLNGDGVISNNGVENNIRGVAAGFEIVDAYARNPLNWEDSASNYLGEIDFDGTSWNQADGVSTNGNIFLGGLASDTALGGVGNDFLVGGGGWGYDHLSGGRNADFFFAELSVLSPTDGEFNSYDGGSTTDDSAAGLSDYLSGANSQNNDWMLVEASDDDEPVYVDLNYDDLGTDQGSWANIYNFESVDASGNLYGFLDDVNVLIGGRATDLRSAPAVPGTTNYGIGSSAQLDIRGSVAANIIVGGYDNDYITANDGNDILLGGNLQFLMETVAGGVTNPNLSNINYDGVDEIYGEDGDDTILLELDGGTVDGGNDSDTVFLTNYTIGRPEATEAESLAASLADGKIRLDLGYYAYKGYRGDTLGEFPVDPEANDTTTSSWRAGTADQTNYAGGVSATTVTGIESVIATGLGQIDYLAAGTNDPELQFANQQNFFATTADLELRGTDKTEEWLGANTLYASSGNDILEGRSGNDKLSGGLGNDDFVFQLQNSGERGQSSFPDGGDGVDVIHRQTDANQDNIWDGTFERDFGLDSSASVGASVLKIDIVKAGGNSPSDELDDVVNFVSEIATGIKVGGSFQAITLNTPAIKAATTYQELADAVNAALDATAFGVDLQAELQADGHTIYITDALGRELADSTTEVAGAGVTVQQKANTQTENTFLFGEPEVLVSQDRLIYKAYDIRERNEGVDDNAITGSTISLGVDSYAEDLVISFGPDGTRIAEDQRYDIKFASLATEDRVTVKVNGVEYSLQVGVDLDGNSIAGEDGVGEGQPAVQAAFLSRLTDFINSFMDDDTAAGKISAALSGDTITIIQAAYHGEETVFVSTPQVLINNLSGGITATAAVTNVSSHQVHLLNFDGRDGALNNDNVLFVGEEFVNRSILETAKTAGGVLNGSEALLIDGGAPTLAGIPTNTATNSPLQGKDFSVHGDDFLLGGAGKDTISGFTGDDRVVGSLGQDVLDGGKDYYAVKVLGEAEARVFQLNTWEATPGNWSKVPALKALTDAGLVITVGAAPIAQTESGTDTVSGNFNDTLIYQQADFTPGVSRFTVTLNDFVVNAGLIELQNGGAGTVGVDTDGNGVVEPGNVSTFKNFENIRTVSGIGHAVADDGQGNDTLDVSAMSTATKGMYYNLTNDGSAGEVWYSANTVPTDVTDPAPFNGGQSGDYEAYVMAVDGVENVIGGGGADLVEIDETEAAKDNTFNGGQGVDRINYLNNFAGYPESEPTVHIRVNDAAETDTVTMTGGRVGSTVAVDKLVGVEFIGLNGNTAQGSLANDVLDVTAMTAGAIVSYVDETVRDLGGNIQVVVENMYQMENVWADGNDTVIVADNDRMGLNANYDGSSTNTLSSTDLADFGTDLTFATFSDYDEVRGGTDRIPFQSQTSVEIQDVMHLNLFTFDLSHTGPGNDSDTVDYSNAVDSISVAVMEGNDQYVQVDGEVAADDTFDFDYVNRVDHLIGVERIVASQAESVIDLTGLGQDTKISFQYVSPAVPAGDDIVETTVRIADGLNNEIAGLPILVERFNNGATGTPTAAWNRIEGSDFDESVYYDGSEDLVNEAGLDHRYTYDELNLRGGDNLVSYFQIETSIYATINVAEDSGTGDGELAADISFLDGTGNDPVVNELPDSGIHNITSYSADNAIAAGTLKLEASQDAEDTVTFGLNSDKVFLLGLSPGVVNVQLNGINNMVLTGFEFLQDALSNDVYDMANLANVAGNLTLIDDGVSPGFGGDHDTIKVRNDAVGFDAPAVPALLLPAITVAANEINLAALNQVFNFDFDVLDVQSVTSAAVTTLIGTTGAGPTDELVLGAINNIATLTDFEGVVLTDATIAQTGNTFVLNTFTNTLTGGAKVLTDTTGALNTVSFRGLVLEADTIDGGQVANVTNGVNFSVAGTSAENVAVYGGNGADNITGGQGNDDLRGGAGNDTLDGGFVAEKVETHTYTLGNPIVLLPFTYTINGVTVTAGSATPGDPAAIVVATGDADAVGAAFVRVWNANPGNFTFDNASPAPNTVTALTYDALTNALTFTFGAGMDPANNVLGAAAGTGAAFVSAETLSQAFTPRAESADTYVFEATAAANGVDTLNNVDASDTLDFSAFGVTFQGATWNASSNIVLSDGDMEVGFNQSTPLTAADVTGLTAGQTAVVLLTADADGLADGTNNPYSVYFVEGTASGTEIITLVGTINSATELTAAQALALL